MTATTKPNEMPIDHHCQVAIVGAGPVGLTIANRLGQSGVNVIVIEKLAALIDYPRAIGIDDEALRTIQSIGLIDEVLPHTTPYHAMRFLTPKGRCFADIQPMTDEFGWSRRNAFIQPQIDAALYRGLSRFKNVKVLFSREVHNLAQDGSGVTLHVKAPGNTEETLRADYLIASDGGNSYVRRHLGIPFDGKTAANQWIVLDIADDPLAIPNVYVCADPVRPYVSAALPHGIRRLEFMVMPGETEEQLNRPENMRKLLGKVLPDPDNIKLIRSRVYNHNARLAGQFRKGRIILAGDAAHIMPVWQGQGYNSGMRDAFNLGWKMALVAQGKAGDALLDTYEIERRDHARAMIEISVLAGNIFAPPKHWQAALRDGITWALGFVPPIKRYFLEMRFKPMPKYSQGAQVAETPYRKASPVGKMFIQPKVGIESGQDMLLDDVIGPGFAIIAWGIDPTLGLTDDQIARWKALGTTFIQVLPSVQMKDTREGDEIVVMLHGSGPGATGWANFNRNIQPLTDAGYRVILMDCPGWGKSDSIVCDSSRSHLNARVLKGLVTTLGLGKINLIGNSMGGHSMVAFALEYPEHVDKLILMGGGTGGTSLFAPMPTEGIKRVGKLYRDLTLENLKEMLDIFVYDTSSLTEDLVQTRLANLLARKDHLENFVKSAALNPKQFPDVSHRLGEISNETLILWGRDDRFVAMDTGLRLLSGLQRAELHVFNRCGHWVQWEYAEKFNRMVLDFLKHGIR